MALLAVLLASCAPTAPDRAAPEATRLPVPPAVCRVGPDGGPVPSGSRTADRGIGGTGAPTGAALRQADRGIGGTGIVAVIIGFASVCLAGQEVALDPGTPVLIGEHPAPPEALRAGQVAVVDAAGPGGTLRARAIAIRYEVSGAVEMADGATLRVAGQRVAVSAAQGDRPASGEWVAVSGLRRPDGVIEATRLDRRAAGEVIVHGRLVRAGELWRIGTLLVRLMPGALAAEGQDVTIQGVMDGNVLQADQLAPDLLASNPTALFGGGVDVVLIETFAVFDQGRIRFGQGFSAVAAGAGTVDAGRSVLALRRDGGGLRAVRIETPNPAAPAAGGGPSLAPAWQFEPAPVPNRALGPYGGNGRAGSGSTGGPGARPGGRPEAGGALRPAEGPGDATPGAGAGPGFGPAADGGLGGGSGRRR